MQTRHIPFFVLIFLILIFVGCEKYIGYDYSAGSIGSRIEISGYLSNIFTGDPVKGAVIDFGLQRTFSDSTGQYGIDYILGADEQRDKPVLLTVLAENYMPFEKSIILYPVDTVISLQLEYGAPIVEKIWIGFWQSLIIFQVKILDYQSIANVTHVFSEMYYFKEGESDSRKLAKDMQLIALLDSNLAVYQSVGPPMLADGWFFDLRKFLISVQDEDGFMDDLDMINSENLSSDTLFTPIPLL